MKLSDKQYWDALYRQKQTQPAENQKIRQKKSIEELLRVTPFRGYADYFLWEKIYPRFLNNKKGEKIVEIGSAPGRELVRMHEVFGLVPYGIEYSEAGVKLNRQEFASHGIDPDNVIHADFLSGEIGEKYKEYFDIVISNGFIEHFDNPREVVDKHINILKKGGLLIISIPNLRGFNYIMQYLFQHSVIQIHNIGIMQTDEYKKLFNDEHLSLQYCGYYGTLNFNLYASKDKSIGSYFLKLFKIMQLPLNSLFRLILGKHGLESKIFSPYLIYIGVRK